jgi:predicted DCC family thiol-disulfide oxidoreductase YuxK
MFAEFEKVAHPPEQPLLIWDGQCGLCKYWVSVWEDRTVGVRYRPYQEAAEGFPEIPLKEFKKASRFITPDGRVFSGPDSAYMSMAHFEKPRKRWHRWYQTKPGFRALSKHGYNFIAKNRSPFMKITIAFWGTDPHNRKPFWLIWLAGFAAIIIAAIMPG